MYNNCIFASLLKKEIERWLLSRIWEPTIRVPLFPSPQLILLRPVAIDHQGPPKASWVWEGHSENIR